MSTRILALVGSLRADSYNRQLAEAAVKHTPDGIDAHHRRAHDAQLRVVRSTYGGADACARGGTDRSGARR